MKMKSLAMLAISGALAASFAYVAPAMADDTSNNGQSMQAPSDNGMQNNSSQNTGSSPSDNSMNNNSNSTSGSDEGSPDTATGDDDY